MPLSSENLEDLVSFIETMAEKYAALPAEDLPPNALEHYSKERIISTLNSALKGLRLALESTRKLVELLKTANAANMRLEDQLKTQEAELIVLRNRWQ
jgi:hypothetical protein